MENESVVKRKFIDYVNRIIEKNKISHAYLFEINNYEMTEENERGIIKQWRKIWRNIKELFNAGMVRLV